MNRTGGVKTHHRKPRPLLDRAAPDLRAGRLEQKLKLVVLCGVDLDGDGIEIGEGIHLGRTRADGTAGGLTVDGREGASG